VAGAGGHEMLQASCGCVLERQPRVYHCGALFSQPVGRVFCVRLSQSLGVVGEAVMRIRFLLHVLSCGACCVSACALVRYFSDYILPGCGCRVVGDSGTQLGLCIWLWNLHACKPFSLAASVGTCLPAFRFCPSSKTALRTHNRGAR